MAEAETAETLDVVARKIEEHAEKSDEHVIAAAVLVAEARRRVEAGEAGDTTWYAWARKKIDLSYSRLYELQCIAEADDPRKELERMRKRTRERVKEHRERKAAEKRALEEERQKLIAWAKKAPIEKVRRILRQVEGESRDQERLVQFPGRPVKAQHRPLAHAAATRIDESERRSGVGT